MRLFLVGLTGAGKSTIGKLVAKHLQYTFTDLDDVIRFETNRSIEDIFEKEGEAYFRKLESQYLKKVAQNDRCVISTGGGTPCYHDSMFFIKQSGISLFLYTPVSLVTERIFSADTTQRPMVKNKTKEELQQFLTLKMEERLPYYAQADFSFDTSLFSSPEKLAVFIVSMLDLLESDSKGAKDYQIGQ